ncbi:hypothetical protein M0R04_00140 [Candidatus Dojkabacteria bacterium]|jgi:hypothetical protein|nr:hypothetical protein [Candidatus Dojkabacteria bacterium]
MPKFPIDPSEVLSGINQVLGAEAKELKTNCDDIGEHSEKQILGYYIANSTEDSNSMYLSLILGNDDGGVTSISAINGPRDFHLLIKRSDGNPIPSDYQDLVELPLNIFVEQILSNATRPLSLSTDENFRKYLKQYAVGLNSLLQDDNFLLSMSSRMEKLKRIIEMINVTFYYFYTDNVIITNPKDSLKG